jgi:hypothetical protein
MLPNTFVLLHRAVASRATPRDLVSEPGLNLFVGKKESG